jgi:hypothetical protein
MKAARVNLSLIKQINRFATASMWSRTPQAGSSIKLTMSTNKKLIVLSLLITLAGGFTLCTRAADPPTDNPTEKPAEKPANKPATTPTRKFQPTEQKLAGKVVAVDKVGRTITLQISGQSYVLQLTESTRIVQAGTTKSFYDLTVGEDVTVDVMLRETNGKIEVAVLSVELAATATAQGKPPGAGTFRPWTGEPNPANIDGPFISPTKPGQRKGR